MIRPDRDRAGVAARPLALIVAITSVVTACSDPPSGSDTDDVAAFCDAVRALQDDDPFADLQVASPEEMRAAFDQLSEGVDRIAAAAPSDASVQADAYQDSVELLVDQLRAAGYDPRGLDPLAYGQATDDYHEAAVSVENAAGALCPPAGG